MFTLTPPLVNWPGPDCDDDREDGFTLIEILVVIVIIGILAAVAIPMFLNQQKAARDSQTTQDTRNAATALETGMVYDSTAKTYRAFADENGAVEYDNGVVPEDVREFWVQVGNGPLTQSVKTEGTYLKVGNDDIDGDGAVDAGAFRIDAWNDRGREYLSDSTLVYRNGLGGIQSTTGNAGGSGGGDTTPGDGTENPDETEDADESIWRLTPTMEDFGAEVSAGTKIIHEYTILGSGDYTWSNPADNIAVPDGSVVHWEVSSNPGVFDTGTSTVTAGKFSVTTTLPEGEARVEDQIDNVWLWPTQVVFPDGTVFMVDDYSEAGAHELVAVYNPTHGNWQPYHAEVVDEGGDDGGDDNGGEQTDDDFSNYHSSEVSLKRNEADGQEITTWTPAAVGANVVSTFDLTVYLGDEYGAPTLKAPSGTRVEYSVEMRISGDWDTSWEGVATGESTVDDDGNWKANYSLPSHSHVPEGSGVGLDVKVTQITFPDGSSVSATSDQPEGLTSLDVAWLFGEWELNPPSDW